MKCQSEHHCLTRDIYDKARVDLDELHWLCVQPGDRVDYGDYPELEQHPKPPLGHNRCRGQRGRAKRQRQRRFSYRQFAAALNPELLAKLQTPRPLATKKRGGSDGSKP